jgi:hypothetical protein
MPETLYLTVNLIDRFLEAKQVTRKHLQLVRTRLRRRAPAVSWRGAACLPARAFAYAQQMAAACCVPTLPPAPTRLSPSPPLAARPGRWA